MLIVVCDCCFQLVYSIMSDNSGGRFSVSSQSDTAVISVAASLDRDIMQPLLQGIYTLQVRTVCQTSKECPMCHVLYKSIARGMLFSYVLCFLTMWYTFSKL